jgi:hypothetical protein
MKVAFIITVYKNDKLIFFKEAIESIVNQDYGFENIHIYLGIDGALYTELDEYIDTHKELFCKVVRNDKNRGLAYTLNRLIDVLEDEEYIFRMDSDDICMPNRVSKQMEYFQKDKELMLLGTDLVEIDEEGKELRYKSMPIKKEEIIKFSIARNPFNHPTVAMRKEFFSQVGTYNEDLLKSQDYELWARALKQNIQYTNINRPLLKFRVASDYMTKRNSFVNYINEIKISFSLMGHFKRYDQVFKVLAKFFIRIMPVFVGKLVYSKLRS